MSDFVTVRQLAEEMLRLSKLLDDQAAALAQAARKHAVAEHAYRQAHATSVLAGSGTAVDKKAVADKASGPEMRDRNVWRAEESLLLEQCRNIRAQLSALSAVAYSTKAEMEMAK